MTKKERYESILNWFSSNMPIAESELNYSNPYELLTAVILSAQCTDKRVNIVTPRLFEQYPTPEALSCASYEEIFETIKSISYPNNKTRHLMGMSKMLVEEFGSIVPSDTEDLQKLPGVGRKTANVIASIIYNKPVIAVDTHVFRISRRLGLSNGETVEKVESDLTKNIPEHLRAISHHWLILHGRYVCTAHRPKCDKCGLSPWCKSYPLG
jgi:endonuclease-3